MKTVCKILLALSLFSSIGGYSQNSNFSFLNEDKPNTNKRGFKVFGEAMAGSNSLNTQMFTEVLIKPTFTEKSKSAFLDGTQTRTNLYASGTCGIEYHKDSSRYFFVRNNSFQAFSSDKDFSELLFFGNGAFRGQKVTTNGLNYMQANTLSAGLGFDIFKSRKLTIKSSIGFSILDNYRQFDAKALYLYTDIDGSYLDVDFDNVSFIDANSGIQGVGLSTDIRLDYFTNESNTISFVANNINAYYLLDNQEIKVDTSFVFNGVPFDFFDAENSVANYLDSAFNETINRNTKTKNTAVLPTQIKLKWVHKLSSQSSIISSFEALSVGKLGMYAQVAFLGTHNNKLKTKTSFGYGNFRGFAWSESVECRVKKYSFYLGVNNPHALLVPTKSKNYGLSVGLFKQL